MSEDAEVTVEERYAALQALCKKQILINEVLKDEIEKLNASLRCTLKERSILIDELLANHLTCRSGISEKLVTTRYGQDYVLENRSDVDESENGAKKRKLEKPILAESDHDQLLTVNQGDSRHFTSSDVQSGSVKSDQPFVDAGAKKAECVSLSHIISLCMRNENIKERKALQLKMSDSTFDCRTDTSIPCAPCTSEVKDDVDCDSVSEDLYYALGSPPPVRVTQPTVSAMLSTGSAQAFPKSPSRSLSGTTSIISGDKQNKDDQFLHHLAQPQKVITHESSPMSAAGGVDGLRQLIPTNGIVRQKHALPFICSASSTTTSSTSALPMKVHSPQLRGTAFVASQVGLKPTLPVIATATSAGELKATLVSSPYAPTTVNRLVTQQRFFVQSPSKLGSTSSPVLATARHESAYTETDRRDVNTAN